MLTIRLYNEKIIFYLKLKMTYRDLHVCSSVNHATHDGQSLHCRRRKRSPRHHCQVKSSRRSLASPLRTSDQAAIKRSAVAQETNTLRTAKQATSFSYLLQDDRDQVKRSSIVLESLHDCIEAVNADLANISNLVLLEIHFPQLGESWVNKKSNRCDIFATGNTLGPPLVLHIGSPTCQILNIRIVGNGLEQSRIAGNANLLIWNLMQQSEDSQKRSFVSRSNTCRLAIGGFFWIGSLGVMLAYSTDARDPLQMPQSTPERRLHDFKSAKQYYLTSSGDREEVNKWLDSRRPDLLLTDLWFEIEPDPIRPDYALQQPLLWLKTFCFGRLFVSNINLVSYLKVAGDLPIFYHGSQFIKSVGVTDTFVQLSSFSNRQFGGNFTATTACEFEFNGKVSILNSSFTGALRCSCLSLSLMNCYLLGVGVSSKDPSDQPSTTATCILSPYNPPGLLHMVDPANLPYPRFLHSACQWVVSTSNWQLQPQETLSDYILKGISEGNEDLLPWRLEGWMETDFTPPAIVYTQGVLYLVTPNADASSNLSHFEAIEVRNTPSLSIPQNDFPLVTIGNPPR